MLLLIMLGESIMKVKVLCR